MISSSGTVIGKMLVLFHSQLFGVILDMIVASMVKETVKFTRKQVPFIVDVLFFVNYLFDELGNLVMA